MKNTSAQFPVGRAAARAGVKIQTLHYYERIGLLKPVSRRASGYRVYDEASVKKVLFIKRAQELGFTLDEIRELLALATSSLDGRPRVRKKAVEKLEAVRTKISDLQDIESALSKLIRHCEKTSLSEPCPIIESLEGRK